MNAVDNDLLDEVKQLIVNCFELELDPAEMGPDTKIMDDGLGLDSIAILDIIAAVERRFDVYVDDGDLAADAFKNLGTLTRFVAKLKARKPENRNDD